MREMTILSRVPTDGELKEAIAEKEESFAQWEEEGYIVDRSDYIYNSTAAFILETGDEGEYVGIAAGVDENFKATGLYAVSAPFTPEPVEYSDAYGRWLGEWTISGYYEDENGIDRPVSYDITIDYLVPNEAFLISGYQVGYDGVQLPGVQATFSAESGNIVFMSSFAGEQYVGNNYYSIYFYATRTAGVSLEYLSGNYTIATAAGFRRHSVRCDRNAVHGTGQRRRMDRILAGSAVPVHNGQETVSQA